jgi:hypothetical protein
VSPGAVIALIAASLIAFVWLALGLGRVFEKFGEPTSSSWVPLLNLATVLRLGALSPLWAPALLIPVLGLVAWAKLIVAIHRITRRLGSGAGMTVVGALALPVWASILGFGTAEPEQELERLTTPIGGYGSLGVPHSAAPTAPVWLAAAPVKPAPRWVLQTEGGASSEITEQVAVLGRNPAVAHGAIQLVPVSDSSKTVSKTHARIALADGVWSITDLNSTNGVHVIAPDGQNLRLVPGVPATITESFRLGDLTLHLRREG